ncbi:KTSC domain-containing protein [Gillisia sp. JM1]|uniref:KTSC domain-containing protein n=1 Tax=Gillisia sp. JM1 TaxID=1283286 RepID=UPI0018CB2FC3|nr:KTSC domain-containing protein [Gillisia sp. JM1]
MKKITISVFLCLIFTFCDGQNCKNLPERFENFNSAKLQIHQTEFFLEDDFDTSRSSWIQNAKYYSCDKQEGFLIISTSSSYYIHSNVPIEVWEKFKHSSSLGRFYNSSLKNKYQLQLNN